MKKIIVAIDGLKYSESTQKYAVHLAGQTNSQLVGVFLDDFTYHSYKIFDLVGSDGISEEKMDRLNDKDGALREESVGRFKEACVSAGLPYEIHHDQSIAIQELLHESVYADLLLIDSRETLMHYEEKIPTRFIHDLLSEVQCPVIVVPQQFAPISKVVLLYDGEPSSVFAIRSFSYLFPSLKQVPTEVITVHSSKQSMYVPDSILMREFMKRHFPKASFTVLNGIAEAEIIAHIGKQVATTLVVLGAYRRGMVSRWFRPSMADTLMEDLKLPLFIAHNR